MNEQKLMSFLGLAQKAGKISSGQMAVVGALRSGKSKLLLIASDAAVNTQNEYRQLAVQYQVEYSEALTMEQMGSCTGKARRAALAVNDAGFVLQIKKMII